MRRSLAPSQVKARASLGGQQPSSSGATCKSGAGEDQDGNVTISRMPMFGFLEIPAALNKQFKVPTGCVVTEKTLELRKVKRLGLPKVFKVVKPGDLSNNIRRTLPAPTALEEDIEEENLPTVQNLPPFERLVLWEDPTDSENKIEVIPELACKLRPHQREGVQFLFECTMGLRGFEGQGCILADDMGLGKTLMSITALWTLLNQGFVKGESAVRKIMVVCPTSLVGNWDNEIRKWVGEKCPTFAVKTEPKKMIKTFLQHRGKGVLIVSYETQRLYSKMFESAMKTSNLLHHQGNTKTSYSAVCDLLICDEAHKLKNAEAELAKSLNLLPAKKRILLSGTPMQNELTEFYNMVNFCNPNVIGNAAEFRKRYERPILAAREPDALPSEVNEAAKLQKELSTIVNEFILKRGNILNAQHLPPKLVQFVCCRLTPLQEALYERLLSSKEIRHIREGKQTNTLNVIRQLINICSHPRLVLDTYHKKLAANEAIDDDLAAIVELIPTTSAPRPMKADANNSMQKKSYNPHATRLDQLKSKLNQAGQLNKMHSSVDSYLDPEQSGKMAVLYRMMQAMRVVNKQERIVIVSNYTSTLDLIETMCKQNHWPALRLDGTISGTKRTKLVEEFNTPTSNAFAFLLSSKAGGCGINLIGGNRLVLFDPDWNPASDKQAAGRIWREGQKRRCFIYRFMSTGSIEEKIIQRQLSKEGLADIVDDKEQVNQFSSEELKQLFTIRKDTRSETHDTLRCTKCKYMKQKQFQQKTEQRLSAPQVEACIKFLDMFEQYLVQESVAYQKRELQRHQHEAGPQSLQDNTVVVEQQLPLHAQLEALRQQLQQSAFESLTSYSRKQRELFHNIENEVQESRAIWKEEAAMSKETKLDEAGNVLPFVSEDKTQYHKLFPQHFSVYTDFLKQWTDLVPSLVSLANKTATKAASSASNNGEEDNANEEDGDFVEQEGCPEDTDFNRWSHHCSPLTCDDELFSKALGDDEALVSFVFGLEVNFSLLEAREAATREENALRKEQQRKDLEELNARRKRRQSGITTDESSAGSEAEDATDAVAELHLAAEGKASKGAKKKVKPNKDEGSSHNKGSSKASTKKRKAEVSAEKVKEWSDVDGVHSADEIFGDSEEGEKEVGGYFQEEEGTAARMEVPRDAEVSKEPSRSKPIADGNASKREEKSNHNNKKKDSKEKEHKLKPNPLDLTAKVAAAASSSSSAASSRRKSSLPLNYTLDPLFQADWNGIKKAVVKGKVGIISFDGFWKVMKAINNNWRSILVGDVGEGLEIFTRTPGLKAEDLHRYVEEVDYFLGVDALMTYVCRQGYLNGDDELAKKFEAFAGNHAPALPPVPVVSTAAPVKKAATNAIAILDKENVLNGSTAEKEAVARKRRKVLDLSDDEMDVEVVPVAAVSRKRASALDSSDEEDSKPMEVAAVNRRVEATDSLLTTLPRISKSAEVTAKPSVPLVIDICTQKSPPGSALKKVHKAIVDNALIDAEEKRVSFHKTQYPTDEMSSNASNASSQPVTNSSQDSGFWTCPICTFENDGVTNELRCDMCNYRRNSSKRKHVDKVISLTQT